MRRTPAALLLRATGAALYNNSGRDQDKLGDYYYQEAYESLDRFKKGTTYPGSIKAATPGDTKCYSGRMDTVYNEVQRHYWRPVVDDPLVVDMIPIRLRFKESVFVSGTWQNRMHVIQVVLPPTSTIGQVKREAMEINDSPFIGQNDFSLARDGKALDEGRTLEEHGIVNEGTLDAIDADDHVSHRDEQKPRDWNVFEVSADDATRSPYKEIAHSMKHLGLKGARMGTTAANLSKYGRGMK
jgi:hypothetical protein